MGEKFPDAFNPEGRKEYENDLPDWKREGETLQAQKILVVHDLETGEYYPVFVYSENEESVLKNEYNSADSAQEVDDVIEL